MNKTNGIVLQIFNSKFHYKIYNFAFVYTKLSNRLKVDFVGCLFCVHIIQVKWRHPVQVEVLPPKWYPEKIEGLSPTPPPPPSIRYWHEVNLKCDVTWALYTTLKYAQRLSPALLFHSLPWRYRCGRFFFCGACGTLDQWPIAAFSTRIGKLNIVQKTHIISERRVVPAGQFHANETRQWFCNAGAAVPNFRYHRRNSGFFYSVGYLIFGCV